MGKLVYGAGKYEKGKYPCSINSKITRNYSIWSAMLQRCYCDKWKFRNPTYKGTSVDKRFLNFQCFMLWLEKQIGFGEDKFELDRNLLGESNLYSPETCALVPQEINKLLNHHRGQRGVLPLGVTYHKRDKEYRAQLKANGKMWFLGGFSNPLDAFHAYKVAKEAWIKELAGKYKSRIDSRVYWVLINYEIKETD